MRSSEVGAPLGHLGALKGVSQGGFFLLHLLFPLLIKFLCISLSGSKKNN